MSSIQFHWNDPPDQCKLGVRDVHVWAADLCRTAEQIAAFELTLASDERDRAARFAFARDRNRFVAGRGVLRAILGTYLKTQPARLRFAYGSRGKPVLADLPGDDDLHFNAAHSDDLLLIAVTRACAVGIDVERIRPLEDAEELADRFFSPSEAAQLTMLPKDRRATAFFDLWTRKEACLKATGQGITELLDQIEVSFLPQDAARVIRISGDSHLAQEWTLQELLPANQFKAALAAAANNLQIISWRWLS